MRRRLDAHPLALAHDRREAARAEERRREDRARAERPVERVLEEPELLDDALVGSARVFFRSALVLAIKTS